MEQTKIDLNRKIKVSQHTLTDYYITDCISRASQTMAKCVKAYKDYLAKHEH